MEAYRAEVAGNKERSLAYKQSAQAERSSLQLKASPYTVSMFTQARGLMKRRAQILKGGWAQEVVQITFVFQCTVVDMTDQLTLWMLGFSSFRLLSLVLSSLNCPKQRRHFIPVVVSFSCGFQFYSCARRHVLISL